MSNGADPSSSDTSGTSFYDVAVIGGGPAGSTVAALLALRGRRVVLFEKTGHPRFHIGESLLPKNLPILARLGVEKEIESIGVLKPGAEFSSPDSPSRQAFLFQDALDPSPPHAFQVRRAEFDEVLFRNARKRGVEVKEGCEVVEAEPSRNGCRLKIRENGAFSNCRVRFLIDASGRDTYFARRRGVRHRSATHNTAAIFAHFESVPADAWTNPGNIAIFWFEHGWIWLIPLSRGLTSVGAVCMPDYLKQRSGKLDEFFLETLKRCPQAWAFLRNARISTPVRGAGNYSYKAERAYGEGFLLLGDAYQFVDPVFSSGVFLAMSSAERAAAAVDEILNDPDRTDETLSRYQRSVDRAIARFSWFIYRFNTPAMQSLFMAPQNFFGVRSAVISMLAGDVYRGGGLSWRLALFRTIYAIVKLVDFKRNWLLEKRRKSLASIAIPENEVAS